MIDAQATTFVLILDPNDGYDEVWAFESATDAAQMVSDNNDYYAGGRYDGITGGKILEGDELAYFLANYTLPSEAVASGDYTPFGEVEDEDDEVEANDEELDAWYNDNRGIYAVDTPEFEARANGEYEDDEEEEDEE